MDQIGFKGYLSNTFYSLQFLVKNSQFLKPKLLHSYTIAAHDQIQQSKIRFKLFWAHYFQKIVKY